MTNGRSHVGSSKKGLIMTKARDFFVNLALMILALPFLACVAAYGMWYILTKGSDAPDAFDIYPEGHPLSSRK